MLTLQLHDGLENERQKKKKLEWKSQKYFQAIIHEQWQRAL
jgi:hypothetical protein